jgi:hypothetical protein
MPTQLFETYFWRQTVSKLKAGMGGSRCGKSRWTTTEDLKESSKTPRRVESTKIVEAELDELLANKPQVKLAMRPRSIPEFTKQLNDHFKIRNGHSYLDARLMCVTRQLELDVLKLDDLLHERHGNYEQNSGQSMSDLITQEYGLAANAFVDAMISAEVMEPTTEERNNLKKRNERT